ncbi:MAG TPA: patatin-like phospholipase family protein [Xanthomonadales bacterium]|nr:patatin-like phospholipase family protein [Xanthomonadales bacterium]
MRSARFGLRRLAALLIAAAPLAAPADDGISCGERAPGDTRPRIGLALGGGGARGIAHIAVLRELERSGVRVDCIAGTSMGSLVGAMYASGMSVDEIEELVTTLDWKRLFNDKIERKESSVRRKTDDRLTLTRVGVGVGRDKVRVATGVLAGQRIQLLFEKLTLPVSSVERFDDLPIPFRAIATDLNTGRAVVLDHGSLALAMRASMSLPGIFTPIEIDGTVLLDGGLANQVPVDVVRAMGADRVVAVDVGTPLAKLGSDASLLAVLDQLTGMMTVGNTRAQLATLGPDDVVIVPELGGSVSTGDFTKGALALEIGAAAAKAARPALAALAAEAGGPVAAREPRVVPPMPIVDFVRMDNTTLYDDEFLLAHLDIEVGKPFQPDAVAEQVQSIYGTETFGIVTYDVVHEDGKTGVVIHARPTSYGPNFLQAGLLLGSDFEGGFSADLRAGLLFAPISSYGAEARVLLQIGSEPGLGGEIYWPFDPKNENIFFANAAYRNPDILLYDDDGNNIATYDVQQLSTQIAYVRELGNYGAITIGLERGIGESEVQTGAAVLPPFDFDIGELDASIFIDRLDNLYFPRDGYFASLSYTASREALGADDDFDQVNLDAIGAWRFGRHAIQAGLRWHETVDGVAPIQSLYRLGGRSQLVGFRRNELTGQHYGVLFGGYLFELADVFGRGAFAGGTLEYGNAWQSRNTIGDDPILNGSVYLGFDSWLGPALFGYGLREGGEGVLFLEIGLPYQ